MVGQCYMHELNMMQHRHDGTVQLEMSCLTASAWASACVHGLDMMQLWYNEPHTTGDVKVQPQNSMFQVIRSAVYERGQMWTS